MNDPGPRAFVHESTVRMANGSDVAAVGAAVTVALCGHWEHDGACRWPHLTTHEASDNTWRVRTTFHVRPDEESRVRERIREALTNGTLATQGRTSNWTVVGDGNTVHQQFS